MVGNEAASGNGEQSVGVKAVEEDAEERATDPGERSAARNTREIVFGPPGEYTVLDFPRGARRIHNRIYSARRRIRGWIR